MSNYRISKNVRKYSSTPIVRPYMDDNGKEKEEMVCICTGKKKDADKLAQKIVELLNQNNTTTLDVGVRVYLITNKNHKGVILNKTDIGFNHWIIKWDNIDNPMVEYGNDLVAYES